MTNRSSKKTEQAKQRERMFPHREAISQNGRTAASRWQGPALLLAQVMKEEPYSKLKHCEVQNMVMKKGSEKLRREGNTEHM